jgi:hypothetical protein
MDNNVKLLLTAVPVTYITYPDIHMYYVSQSEATMPPTSTEQQRRQQAPDKKERAAMRPRR